MALLLLAEHDNTALKGATAKTLTAARAIESDVHILVAGAGEGLQAVAEAAGRLEGVSRVLMAAAPHLAHQLAEEVANVVVGLMPAYGGFVAPATANGKNIAPRVAALLDVMQVSEITAVRGATTFERPIYAGNAVQTVETSQSKLVLTVRVSAFAPSANAGSCASIETIAAPAPFGKSRFVSAELTKSDRPELGAARIVISGGRGLQSAENFQTYIAPLADRLGAAMGASRAAVDAGFAPNDLQVGQTGKVVAPDLYLAVGISGAIQHLAGMKDSKVIVAINKDADAPIFQVADYGLVADLFEALPALERELAKPK